jgi:hypothetical protein
MPRITLTLVVVAIVAYLVGAKFSGPGTALLAKVGA